MSWPVVASSACLVFCLFAFLYFRSYIKRRTGAEAILAEIREEVNRLLLRIDEITENDITLIEDREKSLKALIEETDKRLKVYARELERRENSARALAAMAPEAVHETYAGPGPAVETEPQASRFVRAEKQIPPEPKPVGEQIRELARQGFSSSVIASRLTISITEVELALDLMERKPL
jgi:hypothetical protein